MRVCKPFECSGSRSPSLCILLLWTCVLGECPQSYVLVVDTLKSPSTITHRQTDYFKQVLLRSKFVLIFFKTGFCNSSCNTWWGEIANLVFRTVIRSVVTTWVLRSAQSPPLAVQNSATSRDRWALNEKTHCVTTLYLIYSHPPKINLT